MVLWWSAGRGVRCWGAVLGRITHHRCCLAPYMLSRTRCCLAPNAASHSMLPRTRCCLAPSRIRCCLVPYSASHPMLPRTRVSPCSAVTLVLHLCRFGWQAVTLVLHLCGSGRQASTLVLHLCGFGVLAATLVLSVTLVLQIFIHIHTYVEFLIETRSIKTNPKHKLK